jgi:hypothetical protein
MFLGSKVRPARKADSLTADCLRRCGILDISQLYRSLWPVTEIALRFVDDVRTSQETHLWASTACYRDSFTVLYVDDVRTSQETHLWAYMACYGDSLPVYVQILPYNKHIYGLPRPVTGIALLSYK